MKNNFVKRMGALLLAGTMVCSGIQIPSLESHAARPWQTWSPLRSESGYEKVPYTQLTASADSEQTSGEDDSGDGKSGYASNVVDGDTVSYWHTNYASNHETPRDNTTGLMTGENTITLTLANTETVAGVTWLPRQDAVGNGVIQRFDVEIQTDESSEWTHVYTTPEDVYKHGTDYNNSAWTSDASKAEKEFLFDREYTNVKKIRFIVKKTDGGIGYGNNATMSNPHINAAEIGVLKKAISRPTLKIISPVVGGDAAEVEAVKNLIVDAAEDKADNPTEVTGNVDVTQETIQTVANGNFPGETFTGDVFTGSLTVKNADKLKISSDTGLAITFKYKCAIPLKSGASARPVLNKGNGDTEYAVQFTPSILAFFAHNPSGTWGQVEKTYIRNAFVSKWHTISICCTNNAFTMFIDGQAAAHERDKPEIIDLNKTGDLHLNESNYFGDYFADFKIYSGIGLQGRVESYETLKNELENKTPVFVLGSKEVPEATVNYDITDTTWTDASGNTVTSFDSNTDYTVTSTLQAKDHAKFPEASIPEVFVQKGDETVTLNPQEYDCVRSDDGRTLTITHTFERETLNPALTFTNPIVGSSPADVTAEENPSYTLNTEWTGDFASDGTFAYGEEYTVKATLTANDGYKFTEDTVANIAWAQEGVHPEVTSEVSTDGNTLTLTCCFDAQKEPVNKEALQQKLREAGDILSDTYTTESWDALQAAIDEAKAVYESEDSTQDEVDDQVNALQAALNSLQKKVTGLEILKDGEAVQGTKEKIWKNITETPSPQYQVQFVPEDSTGTLAVEVTDESGNPTEEIVSATLQLDENSEDSSTDIDEVTLEGDLDEDTTASLPTLTLTPKKPGKARIKVYCAENPDIYATFDVVVATEGRILYVDADAREDSSCLLETPFMYDVDGESFNVPEGTLNLPDRAEEGYLATGSDLSLDDVLRKIQNGETEITVKVTYKKACTVKVQGLGWIEQNGENGDKSITVPYMDLVTVKAPATDNGRKFVGWKNVERNVFVSYAYSYTLFARQDSLTLIPVYDTDAKKEIVFDVTGTTELTGTAVGGDGVTGLKKRYKISASRTVPIAKLYKDDTKLIRHGMLVTNKPEFSAADKQAWGLSADGKTIGKVTGITNIQAEGTGLIGTFMANVTTVKNAVYVKAYVVYRNAEGKEVVEMMDDTATINYVE